MGKICTILPNVESNINSLNYWVNLTNVGQTFPNIWDKFTQHSRQHLLHWANLNQYWWNFAQLFRLLIFDPTVGKALAHVLAMYYSTKTNSKLLCFLLFYVSFKSSFLSLHFFELRPSVCHLYGYKCILKPSNDLKWYVHFHVVVTKLIPVLEFRFNKTRNYSCFATSLLQNYRKNWYYCT